MLTMQPSTQPMDTKHMRMSMAGAKTSRAVRKEFDNVKSLYGIPEDSGWSIPMPAEHAKTTRENVHAVFYTCASPEINVAVDDATPKIELVSEEYHGGYFPDWRTATMMSDDTRQNTITTTGDLVDKLDQLDDFFNDDDDAEEMHDSFRESTYEQHTLPILHRSLKRNASVSSFQTGFTDHYGSASSRLGTSHSQGGNDPMRISPSREAMIMTPTAFGGFAPAAPSLGSRPVLHARSITSPTAVPLPSAGLSSSGTYSAGLGSGRSTDDNTLIDEPWEDEDFSPGPMSHTESFPVETTLRPSVGGRFRSMTRRLTGGSADSKTREQIKRDLQKSPRVPKVPDIYVKDLKSSEI
jgi:hypothetical protein